MRRFLKFFAYLSFFGDCVAALGKVYPEWERSYQALKERLETLKTPEEREREEEERKAASANGQQAEDNKNVVDTTYEEVRL